MNKYVITWNTKELKDSGYTVFQVISYLQEYDCEIFEGENQTNGSKITILTNKSMEGLKQELRRVFNVQSFKLK